jgi:hypothetical protein
VHAAIGNPPPSWKLPLGTNEENNMAKRKMGTLAKAQARFMRAMRDFEKAVAGMVSSPTPKAKRKAKKKAKRTKKARSSATRRS